MSSLQAFSNIYVLVFITNLRLKYVKGPCNLAHF